MNEVCPCSKYFLSDATQLHVRIEVIHRSLDTLKRICLSIAATANSKKVGSRLVVDAFPLNWESELTEKPAESGEKNSDTRWTVKLTSTQADMKLSSITSEAYIRIKARFLRD